MKKYAIIVAGGSGSRMRAEVPKQFLLLRNRPILMHTIQSFIQADADTQIVLVLPGSQVPFWFSLMKEYRFRLPHRVVNGGASRFQSVRNGLKHVPHNAVVAVHDGVRPLCPPSVISNSFDIAQERGNAIVAVPSKDSLREIREDDGNRAVDRSAYRIVQTPQTFQSTLLKEAFEVEESPLFTDDASVFEQSGQAIHLIEGDYRNIKITTPEDMAIAEAFSEGLISD